MTIAFEWMGQSCVVEAPPAIAAELEALLPEMARAAGHSARPDLRIREDGPDLVVAAGSEETRCTSPTDALSAVELAITRHLLAAERSHCHLHAAAALVPDGGAVLALGPSGSGKSTLAYAWHRLGRPVLGDDVVAVDHLGLAHAFPRPLKVDAVRLREAGEAPERTVAWDPAASDVWVDPGRGAGWAHGGAPVRLVAEIRYVGGTSLRVEALSAAGALRVLLDSLHRTGTSRSDSLDRLIRVAEGSVACRLEHGDARRAAVFLIEMAAAWRR
ncbi:MAG: hypothetical protein FIA95_10080 [Gemmatimonadetes bacterium]|nr:hypothetical protein [Gemmatimonadota bacterium]